MARAQGLTPAQAIMIEDGLPEAALRTTEEETNRAKKPITQQETTTMMIIKSNSPSRRHDAVAAKAAIEAAKADKPKAKTTSKKAPKCKKAKTSKASARAQSASRADAARKATSPKPNTVQVIADLMARPEGASMDEMVKAIGVEPHPMRSKIKLVRDRLGYSMTAPSKENGRRYFAQPPKKA